MKVVYLSSSSIPSLSANSIHVMKMCQAFAKNGHEVTLLAPNNKKEYVQDVDCVYKYYGVEQSFEIIKLPWPEIKGRGYIYALLAAFMASRLKPDLVFGRNTIGCALAAFADLPVIFESHSPIAESGRFTSWFFDKLSLSKKLKKFVLITHSLKEYYISTHPHLASIITVAPDGADPVSPDVKPVLLPNASKRMQVGYVGHLYEGKGIEVIVELSKHCSWADFHVVGGKEGDLNYWKERAKGVRNLTFYGHVSHAQASSFIKSFDVVLLPNQPIVRVNKKDEIGRWTSPLKMFEYMAAGKPIVASDLPVLREVLTHRRNALLCAHDDIQEWLAALTELVEDSLLARSIGAKARDDFLRSYTWQVRAGCITQ